MGPRGAKQGSLIRELDHGPLEGSDRGISPDSLGLGSPGRTLLPSPPLSTRAKDTSLARLISVPDDDQKDFRTGFSMHRIVRLRFGQKTVEVGFVSFVSLPFLSSGVLVPEAGKKCWKLDVLRTSRSRRVGYHSPEARPQASVVWRHLPSRGTVGLPSLYICLS